MKQKAAKGLAVAGILAAAFTVVGGSAYYTYGTADNVDIKVTDKERVVQRSGDTISSKYLVFTENEVFENTDSFLKLKFNSSDVYRKLEEGQSYNCDVYGKRVPFLSMYRNIVECAPKSPGQ